MDVTTQGIVDALERRALSPYSQPRAGEIITANSAEIARLRAENAALQRTLDALESWAGVHEEAA